MFAQVPGKAGPLQSVEFLVTVGLLMAVLLAGAAVLYVTDMWRKKRERRSAEGVETLSMYRDMYENDELSEEEYCVIRDRIARQMKAGVRPLGGPELGGGAVGASPAVPAAAPPPPAGPPGAVS